MDYLLEDSILSETFSCRFDFCKKLINVAKCHAVSRLEVISKRLVGGGGIRPFFQP